MSVEDLILTRGVTLRINRTTWTRSANGGPTVSATSVTTATGFVQVAGATTSRRYGSERARFEAVAYLTSDVDIEPTDIVTYQDRVDTRTYRVESVRTPDEVDPEDGMSYQIAMLQEDRPRT